MLLGCCFSVAIIKGVAPAYVDDTDASFRIVRRQLMQRTVVFAKMLSRVESMIWITLRFPVAAASCSSVHPSYKHTMRLCMDHEMRHTPEVWSSHAPFPSKLETTGVWPL